ARTFSHHTGGVKSVAFGGDRWLVSGGEDGTVQLWEPFTSNPPRLLGKHDKMVWCVAMSPDCTRVASGSGDWQQREQLGEVKVCTRTAAEQPLLLRAHAGLVWGVAFSPDGGRLATAGGEWGTPGEVRLWDVRTGQPLLTIPQPRGIKQIVFSPDGRRLAGVMPHANAVKVWDAVTGQELLSQVVNSPFCVAFSPHGRQLAAGNRGRLIIVW